MSLLSRIALGALLLGVGLALSGANVGQDRIPIGHNGHIILSVRVGAGGLTAQERAEIVQRRIDSAMAWQFERPEQCLIPGALRVEPSGACAVVTCGPIPLITVTSLDAKSNKTSVDGLAELWRGRAAEVLEIATRTG